MYPEHVHCAIQNYSPVQKLINTLNKNNARARVQKLKHGII